MPIFSRYHPLSPGILAGLREAKDNFLRSRRQLHYEIPKAELWRIFHLSSAVYNEEIASTGVRIRTHAGYATSANAHEEVHGHGYTKVIFRDQAGLYANMVKSGIGYDTVNPRPNLDKMVMDGLRSLGRMRFLLPLRKSLNVGSAADQPAHRCELAIVAEERGKPPSERNAYFGLRAEYMDTESSEDVTLRGIFMPVADANGVITGTREINSKTPDADIEVLRALIAFKLVASRLADNRPMDIAACVKAAESLPLTEESTLHEYLTYDFE